METEYNFRLVDFNVYDSQNDLFEEDDEYESFCPKFTIQMFGINEKGNTCSIIAENYTPFFYILVNETWNDTVKTAFLKHIVGKCKIKDDAIISCKFVKKRKLYGFDNRKEHKFIKLEFVNMQIFNKVKNLWYKKTETSYSLLKTKNQIGYPFNNTYTQIYESNIPPLLRFFHINEISPSGWISIPLTSENIRSKQLKKTICDYEFTVDFKDITPLNNKETRVPYKIMSFDIEASSSHGDFPIPIKSYKKLATNIVDYFMDLDKSKEQYKSILKDILLFAFGFEEIEGNDSLHQKIEKVYPKKQIKSKDELLKLFELWVNKPLLFNEIDNENYQIEKLFEKMHNEYKKTFTEHELECEENNLNENAKEDEEEDENDDYDIDNIDNIPNINNNTVIDLIKNKDITRDVKLNLINDSFYCKGRNDNIFPELEGDKVTFIGSTFMYYGDKNPYKNHCAVLNSCLNPSENTEIETFDNEKDVLLAWQRLVQKENPDIIIGYNIFGFDYTFMFKRAEENNCVEEFLKLSRNKNEICGNPIKDSIGSPTGKYKLEESSIQLASGQYDLRFIKMTGRLQIDLYNHYRRVENLSSYKLDYVSGYFIGDYVKSILVIDLYTEIETNNMTGLLVGSYIRFEEMDYSVDYYENGAKFMVTEINTETKKFKIEGLLNFDFKKKIRWCLAKDDVSPKDIFRMTNGTAEDRSIIAKYCIQDCNLVHYLLNKSDVLTGYIEMSKICSIPINFLVMRGQGIKLTSCIAKKCLKNDTLMPVIEKNEFDDGYEGAIVLDPKCGLYLSNPIACVDYAGLYPSSMISENLSHDSKVWTKEYDLFGNLIKEWGEKEKGVYIYDNLPGREYVDVEYDVYRYVKSEKKKKATKVKIGYKICRYIQPYKDENGVEVDGIMPSILKELLKARKDTRKLIPGEKDDFMKAVLEQRQLGYKLTANSLYGGCGARTSAFYEKDIAACTTATGRKLLTYAKKVIEETYGDKICETEKYGPVLTKAEYIYGDSVANYTPIYIKVNGIIDILTIEELGIKYGNNNWVKCVEEGKQDKEFCELINIETWTEKGWTPLYRVIRHQLASHKKMIRIYTKTSLVDVTDDHSLILKSGETISPNDFRYNNDYELLHCKLNELYDNKLDFNIYKIHNTDIYQFQDMITAAKFTNYLNYMNINYKIYPSTFNEILIHIIENNTYNNNLKCIDEIYDYKGYVYDLTTENNHFAAGIGDIIVHNTDSVFFTFNLQTPSGESIQGKKALEITIELAQQAGHLASSFLKAPHDLEYEKTFMPFCLLSKKRYVGMLYETDPNKCKRKEMGIVLKRRDNAPIVKDIYGGIIDILMKTQNIQEAINFLQTSLKNVVDGNCPIEKLIITKSLRSGYKKPNSIAHKVLADRIAAREPGNKPSPGDRIQFVYFAVEKTFKKLLQGDKIETPTFILENKLKIDYEFYITNQIMKPIQQLFSLVLENIWQMQNKILKLKKFKKEIENLKIKYKDDIVKYQEKLEKLKNDEIKLMLFDEFLIQSNNSKKGLQNVMTFFDKKN